MSFPEEFGLLNYAVHMNAIYCCCAQLYEEAGGGGAAVNLPRFIFCWLSSDRRAGKYEKKKEQTKKEEDFSREEQRRNIKREGRNGKTE